MGHLRRGRCSEGPEEKKKWAKAAVARKRHLPGKKGRVSCLSSSEKGGERTANDDKGGEK